MSVATLDARQQDHALLLCLKRHVRPPWIIEQKQDNLVTWIVCTPGGARMQPAGWKVHVSCSPGETELCANIVTPILVAHRVAFKMCADKKSATLINSGLAGETQVGKILTMYPSDDAVLPGLVDRLLAAFPRSLGPRLVSDMPLSESGHLGLRYGVFVRRSSVRDVVGRQIDLISLADGGLHQDVRNKDGAAPEWAPRPPAGLKFYAQHKSRTALRTATVSWAAVATLRENQKGVVCLAMRTSSPWDRAIVKTARRGVLLGTPEYDAVSLLAREHAILTTLPDTQAHWPKALMFQRSGDAILVQSDISGAMAAEHSQMTAWQKIQAIVLAVTRLHGCGVVHRDIKPTNIIIDDTGKAQLVDFELASQVNDATSPPTGTPGFCDREKLGDASYSRDRYGLAATAYSLFTQENPCSLPPRTHAMIAVLSLCGMQPQAQFLDRLLCCDPEAPVVPELNDLAVTLSRRSRADVVVAPRRLESNRRWAKRSAADMLGLLSHFERKGKNGIFWKVDRATSDSAETSLARGSCGITLALMSIRHLLGRPELSESILQSCTYLAHLSPSESPPGLFTGKAGLAVCLAAAARAYGEKKLAAHARKLIERSMKETEKDHDLYFGSAGVLYAATIVAALDPAFDIEVGRAVASSLLSSVFSQDGVLVWPNPGTLGKDTTPFLGASHGASGIALALARWGQMTGHRDAAKLASDVMLSLFEHGLTSDGQQLRSQFEPGPSARSANIWCHGLGGYLWCLLQMDFVENSFSLEPAVTWAAERLIGAVPAGNVTFCHGLSARLEMLMMISAKIPSLAVRAHQAANVTANILRALSTRCHGRVRWGAEDASIVSPELWTGFTGPLVAITRWEASRRDALLSHSWLTEISAPNGVTHED